MNEIWINRETDIHWTTDIFNKKVPGDLVKITLYWLLQIIGMLIKK